MTVKNISNHRTVLVTISTFVFVVVYSFLHQFESIFPLFPLLFLDILVAKLCIALPSAARIVPKSYADMTVSCSSRDTGIRHNPGRKQSNGLTTVGTFHLQIDKVILEFSALRECV